MSGEVQGSLFDIEEGNARKERQLTLLENDHAEVLEKIRSALVALWKDRDMTYRLHRLPGLPEPIVSADDAVDILTKLDKGAEPGAWLGSVFRTPGWEFTGKWAASARATNNGRHVRTWKWAGA